MNIEDFKIYLPKYLSPESTKDLINSIKEFPKNNGYYSDFGIEDSIIYQGDGLIDLPVVSYDKTGIPAIKKVPCIIISNTCDSDLSNIRFFSSQLTYAPILNLRKYIKHIKDHSTKTPESIDGHIESIKNQQITQILYLPQKGTMEESIVFLDRINNYPNKLIARDLVPKQRLFTLNNYGYYLFLFKLSIHFTRMYDKIDRA